MFISGGEGDFQSPVIKTCFGPILNICVEGSLHPVPMESLSREEGLEPLTRDS